MKTVLYAIGALVISATTAAAAPGVTQPSTERASVKPSERGDREMSRGHRDHAPVALQREIPFEFEAESPTPSMQSPGGGAPRGWTGNDNPG